MNKVLNINLGGYPITIDEDAFVFLEGYLRNIEVRFHESEGRADIMRDIEMRLGELLTAELGTRRIIMFPDVQEVARIMGQPEDFGADPVPTATGSQSRGGEEAEQRSKGLRPGRRLFRDKDEKIAGGVCSGLSAYLGIEDPLWLRLAFVLLTIASSGFWIMAYLIAWVMIPESRSAADRLAMRGEPINVDNIAREIETGFSRLESEMDSMGQRSRERGSETAGRVHDALGSLMGLIGSAFAAVVRFMGKFGVALMVLVLIALVISLVMSWMAGMLAFFTALPLMEYFSPLHAGLNTLGATGMMATVTIPIVAMVMGLSGVLFKLRTPGFVWLSIMLTWVASVVATLFVGGKILGSYVQESTVKSVMEVALPESSLLKLHSMDDWDWASYSIRQSGIKPAVAGSLKFPNLLRIRVQPSPDGRCRVIQAVSARGRDQGEAEAAARVVTLAEIKANEVWIPGTFTLTKGQGWRNQRLEVTLQIPEGSSLVFDEQTSRISEVIQDISGDAIRPGAVLTMSADGRLVAR